MIVRVCVYTSELNSVTRAAHVPRAAAHVPRMAAHVPRVATHVLRAAAHAPRTAAHVPLSLFRVSTPNGKLFRSGFLQKLSSQ